MSEQQTYPNFLSAALPSPNPFPVEPPPPETPVSGTDINKNAFGGTTPTTNTTATGINNVDGLLIGTEWLSNTVTYGFTDNFFNDYESWYSNYSSHASSFETLNPTQRNAARSWFDMYQSVSGLNPVELTGTSDRDATIRMAESDDPPTAYAYYPNSSFVEGGDAWFNRTSYNNPIIGNYAFYTVGHEIGHALGLKHGHESGGVSGVSMDYDRDSSEFSIMTYRSYIGHDLNALPFLTHESSSSPQSLMMYDIRAIQQMYGANFNTNSGNTNYTFSPTTGEMFVNGVGQGTPTANRIFRTIWDGNGVDTYNLSNYSSNLNIDLTPGGWSDLDVGGNAQRAILNPGYGGIVEYARAHLFNAVQYNGDSRSLIENATGGSGNDTILGNDANNTLRGGSGDDNILGVNGNDFLIGNDGNDNISGGANNDTVYGGNGGDDINGGSGNDELAGGNGNDTVSGGTGNDSVYGGWDNDLLYGDAGSDLIAGSEGSDTVYGGSETDTIWGGAGNDAIYGQDGDDFFAGGFGSDFLNGGNDNDTVYGSAGNDTVWGLYGDDLVAGGDGNDRVEADWGNDTAYGSAGDDDVYGGDGDDLIAGGDGNDTLTGGPGNDEIYGSPGNDVIIGAGVQWFGSPDALSPDSIKSSNLTANSFGVNELDTLVGATGPGQDTFVLTDSLTTDYYIGNGINDYALILGMTSNDLIDVFNPGAVTVDTTANFGFTSVPSGVAIVNSGDLISIVQGGFTPAQIQNALV